MAITALPLAAKLCTLTSIGRGVQPCCFSVISVMFTFSPAYTLCRPFPIIPASLQGLMVILDNHSSDAMWCCGLDDGNGLWYTATWTEQQWLAGWALVARRYVNTTSVIGMGLRNEPRPTFISACSTGR